jgi:hypothetical protein
LFGLERAALDPLRLQEAIDAIGVDHAVGLGRRCEEPWGRVSQPARGRQVAG